MTSRWWVAVAFTLLPILPAHAAEDQKLFGAEATIPSTRVLRFTSAIDGEPFTLEVRKPFGPPPKDGYSVLYVLDGELYFSIAQFLSYALPGTSPVVVGIGHNALRNKDVIMRYAKSPLKDASKLGVDEAFAAFSNLRVRDFTLPPAPEHRAPIWLGSEGGNIDQFLKVIETEIKPRIAALVPVNAADQALYGHSLGGLAVIRALFTEPNAFRTFIASSPSLWWDGNAVLKGEAAFANQVRSGRTAPKILITAAAGEPDEPPPDRDYLKTLTPDKAAEIAPYAKMSHSWAGMKTGSRALADRLGKISGKTGYKVSYELIPDVDHGSEPRVALIHAMDFAFPR